MNSKITRRLLLIVVITGIALVVLYRESVDVAALERWIKEAGLAGPILFMLIYALGTVFFLPGSVLTLAGGALFGPVWGTLYNLSGATVGATLAFLIARYLASDWVEQKASGRLKQLKQGVENEGWRFVALVRLVPLFPFNLLNYALGLTRIKLSHYIVASYLCMLPGAIAYTYLGYAGREALAGGENLVQKVLLALSLLALVAFLPRLISRLRQKPLMNAAEVKQRLDAGQDLFILDVRTPEEFSGEQGHIAGATNIPLETLPDRLAELGDYQRRLIVLVCRAERRSGQAAQLLVRSGFTDVFVAKGGMTAWRENGFTVKQ